MISILIPAYKNINVLRLLLNSLTTQSYNGFYNIFLINDGGDHSIEDLCKEFYKLKIKYSYLYPKTDLVRRSLALNTIIKSNIDTLQERILVIDSDCIVSNDVLNMHDKYGGQDVIVCGIRYRVPKSKFLEKYKSLINGSNTINFKNLYDISNKIDDRYNANLEWKQKRLVDVLSMERREAYFPHLCHGFQISYPTRKLLEVGLFNENYTYRQDQDVAQRLVKAGCSTLLLPESVCYHIDHEATNFDRSDSTKLYESQWGGNPYI